MPETWTCRCGGKNASAWQNCEGCGRANPKARLHVVRDTEPTAAPIATAEERGPIGTSEQNAEAAKVFRAVLRGEITTAEGDRRMLAIFAERKAIGGPLDAAGHSGSATARNSSRSEVPDSAKENTT
jgi:hypothetical protein